MADNTELASGSGGDTLATDDISGVKYPRSKIVIGADGTNDGDVSSANPLPVTGPLTDTELRATAVPISVATIPSHDVTNAGTFVVQVDGTALTRLTDIETNTDNLSNAIGQTGVAGPSHTISIAGTRSTGELREVLVSATGELSVDQAGNLNTWIGEDIALNSGNLTDGTLRVAIATDDVNLAILSGAVSGSEMQTDVVTQPARDNATDTITASLDTAAIMNDTTALTPKFAAINATTNGDNTIVAAIVGKKCRVLSYTLVADAAVGGAFEDGAGGTELTGQMAMAANGGVVVPFSPVGHFETTANTILNLELDAAANVRGHVTYVEV